MTITSTLSEVAEINPRGPRPSGDEVVSFVGMADLSAETGVGGPGTERQFGEVSKGYTIFKNQDLLVAKITPCFENGKTGQATLPRPIGVGSTEFHVVRPRSDRLDARYAFHFLRQERIRLDGERRMTGSAGQRRVPTNFLSELSIPLPPVEEQRRIAAILDHADALRAKRRQVLAHLDTLPQAIFHDWFDVGRESSWPTLRVGQVGRIQLGRQRAPKFQTGKWTRPYMRVANVQKNRLELNDVLRMDFDPKDFAAYRLEEGDILLNEGQSTELVGRPAMWSGQIEDCCFQNTLLRFQADRSLVDPYFALSVFLDNLHSGEFARVSSKTSNVAHLGKERFRAMPIVVPPLSIQREFTHRVRQVGQQRVSVQRALSTSDALFSSLQSRAFRGEL